MRRPISRFSLSLSLAIAVLALSACAEDEPAAEGVVAEAPPAAVAQAVIPQPGSDQLTDWRLSEEQLTQLTAAMRNLEQAARADPAFAQAMNAENERAETGEDVPLAQQVGHIRDRINRLPQARQAIERAGLSPDEYALTSIALIQAAIYSAALRQNPSANVPAEIPRENLAFVERNQELVRSAFAQLNQLSKLGEDETGEVQEP